MISLSKSLSKSMMLWTLLLVSMLLFVTASYPICAATLDKRVAVDTDDAEENIATGGMYLDSSDLEMIYDSGSQINQLIGIRFTGVTVPKGSTITNAYIQFTTDEVSTGSVSLAIKGQAADNAAAFTSSAYNISGRTRTTAQVNWSPANWNTIDEAGANQRTPDLKSIVQEIVNRTNWASGNAMVFIVSGANGNRRCARSYLSGSSKAPLLHIEYSVGATPTPTRVDGSTPTPTPVSGLYQVYYGHLHNHSNVSDGTGTPSQAYAYARDVARLDFFSLADHAESISSTEWTDIKNAANTYNQDGSFVTFWGFEWSSSTKGHVAVINTTDYCTSSSSATDTFPELVTWLSSRDGVAFFNHPGRQDSTGEEFSHFTSTPSSKFVGMELWNKSDAFDVYYYTDGYYSNDGNKGHFDEAIARGWRIGAAGADDNHNGTWGTANEFRLAVLSTAKTRSAIYDALNARRFYTTLDLNLVLSFTIGGFPMGAFINSGTHSMVITASDGNYEQFTRVELLKNGAVVSTWTPNSPNPNITQNLTCVSGDYFYVRVRQVDGGEAISSPIFVN